MMSLDRTTPAPDPAERAGAGAPVVLALVSDLMLTVRLEAAARAAGCGIAFLAAPAGLATALAHRPPALVLFDLAEGAFPIETTLRQLRERAPRASVLAFYPHVRKDLEARARAAGCDLFMPRSRFLLDLPAALRLGLRGRDGGPTRGDVQ